ncbi:endonuclease [Gammaproteobacteria bacterium]|nr:endonuclease [Gammaproteobacteria bacterium]
MKKLIFASWLWLSCVLAAIAAIPAGYYQNATNLNQAALKSALNSIISSGTFLDYGSGVDHTWQGFYYTDRNATTNRVTDMYSDSIFYQTDPLSSVPGMHIEHAMPKSWWGGMNISTHANCDLFHLYPSEDQINMSKSNKPLGENNGETRDNSVSQCGANTFEAHLFSGPCFEPADEFKGDFARSYFYVATAYGELATLTTFDTSYNTMLADGGNYPWFKQWAIDLLLKWDRQDPISQKELDRQEVVFGIQHNRNPFIDFAGLAEYIWGNKTNETFIVVGETRPFLSQPSRFTTIDFGTIFTNQSSNQNLVIQGANFTSAIALSNTNSAITLSAASVTPSQITNGFTLTLSLQSATPNSIIDTLVISSSELSEAYKIPITARISNNFRVLDASNIGITSAQLNWMSVPNTTSYEVNVYENNAPRMGDLIISTYIEGSSYNKVIELYNGTGSSIDLSEYALARTDNGDNDFSRFNKTLSGTLANNTHYIIASSKVDVALVPNADILLNASSTDDSDKAAGFNGDDAVALFHNGEIIDQIGLLDGSEWGKDATYSRHATVYAPSSSYNESQWTKSSSNDVSTLGSFNFTSTNPTSQNFTSNTASLVVSSLKPATTYYVSAKAISSATTESTNLIGFTTLPIPAPIALEASDLSNTHFTANWEKIDGVDDYELDLYTTTGTGAVADTTDFTGSVLPTDWTFSGSLGWYTTATSTGNSVPSLKLAIDGDMLSSKTFAGAVTSISFMYRYTSSRAKNNTLDVEVLSNGSWINKETITYTNTSKTTQTISCTAAENVTAVRWVFHKVSYNMAIDDIIINYGSSVKNYVLQNQAVSGESYVANNLTKSTEYFYVVRAKIGSETSPNSNIQSITTLENEPVSTETIEEENIELHTQDLTLSISNLGNQTRDISVYETTGRRVYHIQTNKQTEIPLTHKGIYIVKVDTKIFKIVL